MEATTKSQDQDKIIEEHCRIINEAREKFMHKKITADQYWKTRVTHLTAILNLNEKN